MRREGKGKWHHDYKLSGHKTSPVEKEVISHGQQQYTNQFCGIRQLVEPGQLGHGIIELELEYDF